MDSSQNYTRFRNYDATVPAQNFLRSIGVGKEGGKVIPLSHDVDASAKITAAQEAARRGPVLENVVPSVRAANARKDAGGVLKPWAQPNELDPK
jgi:hypothetical protein